MFNAFSRSWQLGKQSLQVLKQDSQLIVFPLVSMVSCLIVLASFAVPLLLTTNIADVWQQSSQGSHLNVQLTPLHYVVGFAFYFVNYAVIAFFNSALIACVMKRFDGKPTSVSDGLRMAAARLPQILGWALISSTVGMILQTISEKSGLVGKIVTGLIGFVWTIATYFVVPVLVVEGVGPIEAIKRSGATIRKTWGESLILNAGLGGITALMIIGAFVPLAAGIVGTVFVQSAGPVLVGIGFTLGCLIGVSLVASTLQAIIVAAVYRFAATGVVPGGFSEELLTKAFRQKKDRN